MNGKDYALECCCHCEYHLFEASNLCVLLSARRCASVVFKEMEMMLWIGLLLVVSILSPKLVACVISGQSAVTHLYVVSLHFF